MSDKSVATEVLSVPQMQAQFEVGPVFGYFQFPSPQMSLVEQNFSSDVHSALRAALNAGVKWPGSYETWDGGVTYFTGSKVKISVTDDDKFTFKYLANIYWSCDSKVEAEKKEVADRLVEQWTEWAEVTPPVRRKYAAQLFRSRICEIVKWQRLMWLATNEPLPVLETAASLTREFEGDFDELVRTARALEGVE